MNRKNDNSKKKGAGRRNDSPRRHPRPISKSGDASESIYALDKAKALEDIQQVFAEVAEEYPEFLEETDAEAMDQRIGDGFDFLTSGGTRSTASRYGSCVKQPESRKTVKTTTIRGKSSLPPPPSGPPPNAKTWFGPDGPKLEPEIVEIFKKPDVDLSLPNTASDAPSTSDSMSLSDVLSKIVQKAEAEPLSEESGPHCDQTLIRNPRPFDSSSSSGKNRKKFIPPPMGKESRIALACQITNDSILTPVTTTTATEEEGSTPSRPHVYQPRTVTMGSRLSTVSGNKLEHEVFASEFIKGLELQPEDFEEAMKREVVSFDYAPPEEVKDESSKDARQPPPLYTMNSLKLVHKYPIWPHQVSLSKTLCHLPALKSVILDDSEIVWLRDLGSFLPNLITLSVMRCQLTSLDGIMSFPNLENLFAADNKIQSPAQLSHLSNLRFVDLSGNPIDSFEGFHFLRICSKLKCLKLTDTGIGNLPNFQKDMRSMIPSIRELQPRIPAIHGSDAFRTNEDLCFPVLNSESEQWFEYKVKQTTEWGSSASASGMSTPAEFRQGKEKKQVSWKMDYRGVDLESQGDTRQADTSKEMDSVTEELEWRDEEKRLRDVYIPGRVEFKNRGPAVVPSGIDEMDALLDELEESSSLSSVKAAVSSEEDAMRPIGLTPLNDVNGA